jgi:signal peptidase I
MSPGANAIVLAIVFSIALPGCGREPSPLIQHKADDPADSVPSRPAGHADNESTALRKVEFPTDAVASLPPFPFKTYVIPQNGMYPSMPAKSRLFAVLRPYKEPSQVARGDIVLFQLIDDGTRYDYIWRVIGLPGDEIVCLKDDVFVNNKQLEREQVRVDGDKVIYKEKNGGAEYEVAYSKTAPTKPPPDVKLTVPKDHFFLLGDNRNNASDSRYHGVVPFGAIIAKKP